MSNPANFNDTLPAAIAGKTNVNFQLDPATGNISACVETSSLVLQTNGTANGSQILLNLQAGGGTSLTDNGAGRVMIASATAPVFDTNGVANTVQSALNLVAGSNITLTAVGSAVTIAASGGGGGGTIYFQSANNSAVTPSGAAFNAKGVIITPTSTVKLYSVQIPCMFNSTANCQLILQAVSSGSTVGAVLYTSPTVSANPSSSTWKNVFFDLSATPLTLTAGNEYAIFLQFPTQSGTFVNPMSGCLGQQLFTPGIPPQTLGIAYAGVNPASGTVLTTSTTLWCMNLMTSF